MGQTPFQKLARKLKIKKPDWDLLKQALTHKSYLGEQGWLSSNERLEFLGDSVLGLIVSEYLFKTFTDRPEGELAKAKAVVVSEPILADASKKIGIPDALLVSAGEDMSGGRGRSSILADAFEAVIAAIYLSHGLDAARDFILKSLGPVIEDIEGEEHQRNYKSVLQELTQSMYKKAPEYAVISEAGADHDKTFTVQVHIDHTLLGVGEGKSKKQAEQAAAFEALQSPLIEAERWRNKRP
jgi:ribonuclease-3